MLPETPVLEREQPDAKPAATRSIVTMEAVAFSYGSRKALAGLSLELQAGQITGLLGHNGAGKTTAIKLVNGLLRPLEGTVRVNGFDPSLETSEARSFMAVVTDTLGLSERETPRRTFRYHADLYGFDRDETMETGIEWLNRFGIGEHVDRPVKTFSRGMRQRLAMCRALAGNPQVLLLDEPTLGMDPVARQDFRAAIAQFRYDGGTVLMSTHDLGEVERTCQQVVVLQQGKVVTSGTTEGFMRPLFRDLDVEMELEEITLDMLQALHSLGSLRDISHDKTHISFQARERAAIADAVQTLVLAGGRVLRIGSNTPTLEDAYLNLHGAPKA